MSRRRIATLTAAMTLALSAGLSTNAGASYHEVKISEVHAGGGGTGDYIELQAYSAGQNFLAGHYIRTYDNGGNQLSQFQFPGAAGSGEAQRTILIGDTASVSGVTADFIAAGMQVTQNTGGAACYIDTLAPLVGVDCVSFGAFNAGGIVGGNPSPIGSPAAAGTGIPTDGSLQRSIAPNCTTALDAADDTNNSATDFAVGAPTPRNNATAPTERVCVPCKGLTSTITGTDGAETLVGTPAADVIAGKGGKDKLKGLAGNDTICGGAGKDTLIGGGGKDTLLGEAGKDILKGGKGKDKLIGGPGKDKQAQ